MNTGPDLHSHEGEVAFAVIQVTSTDETAIRGLGERLWTWKESNPEVNRIIGLQQMLEGHSPETATYYFGFPESEADPESRFEPAALVMVKVEPVEGTLAAGLVKLIEGSGVASVTSYIQYCYMNG